MAPHLDKLQAEFALLLICTHTSVTDIYILLCEERCSQEVPVLAETRGFQVYQITGI